MARVNPAGILSYEGPDVDLSQFIEGRKDKAILRESQLREEELMRERSEREEMKGILSQMDPNSPNYESAAAMLLKSGNVDAANQLLNIDLKNKEYGLQERASELDERRFGLQAAESGERIRGQRFDRAYKEQMIRNEQAYERIASEVGLTQRALTNLEGIEDPEQAQEVLNKFIKTIDPLNQERKRMGLEPISIPQELKSGDIQERIGYLKEISEIGNQKLQMLDSMRGEGEGFTLKPGEVRYTAGGKKIAEVASESRQTPYTDLGKLSMDLKNGLISPSDYELASKYIIDGSDKDNFEGEEKLRKEYNGLSKEFSDIENSYSRIKASSIDPSGAGDMSLIFSYMKLLDPGSTVREGEYATAQNAGSVPERVFALYNKTVDGKFLTDTQREDFVDRSEKIFKVQVEKQKQIKKRYTDLAEAYKLNPKNVVTKFLGENGENTPEDPGAQGQGTNPAITTPYDQIKPKFLGFEE